MKDQILDDVELLDELASEVELLTPVADTTYDASGGKTAPEF